MSDVSQQKIQANGLRKSGNIEEALPLYKELWGQTHDAYDGTGLLHCMRKIKLFDEAVVLADDLHNKYPDFEWAKNEIIWTYIQGKLNVSNENTPIQALIDIANQIMSLNPKGLAEKTIVFKVLKSAKSSNHWGIVNEWIIKIDPSFLSDAPISIDNGKEGWSEQAQWYNYRINGLIKEHGSEERLLIESITLADKAIQLFPKQRKFFLRLKALSYFQLGSPNEAAEIYNTLCNRVKADWWLLHEYAKVLQAQGHDEDALKLMFQAACSYYKLESMVTLFIDIGQLCYKMEKYKEARAHLVLCKYVRESRGWGIPEQITSSINTINQLLKDSGPSSQREAYEICRSEWAQSIGEEDSRQNLNNKREAKHGLIGKVSSIKVERPFCFIITSDDSFFCRNSELPPSINNGDEVLFDAIPSYDKKKEKESWRAVNIKCR